MKVTNIKRFVALFLKWMRDLETCELSRTADTS